MKHFDLILCPVDFSENSYHAIEQASFLAQLFQADLTLVHVIQNTLPEALGVVRGMDLSSQRTLDQATARARTLLREAKQKYVPYAITCKSSIRYGDVAQGILQEAEARKVSLIFMACEGDNGACLMGGVTKEVVEGAFCPVLTYHHEEDRMGFRKILLPVDPETGLGEIHGYLSKLFSMMSPQLILAAVLSPDAAEEEKAQLLQQLASVTALLLDQGLQDVVPEVVVVRDPALGLAELAQSRDCHLVMMQGQHLFGDKGERKPVLTHSLMRSLRRPIFTFRSPLNETAANA